MWSRILAVFLSLSIILIPIEVSGQEVGELQGRVTALAQGEDAPYAGILLDEIASAKMVADKKYAILELELKLHKEFAKEFADKKLAFDLLQAEHGTLTKTHEALMGIKEDQITDLNKMLKDEISADYSALWFAGGVVAGILVSVAIFFAAVEIKKYAD